MTVGVKLFACILPSKEFDVAFGKPFEVVPPAIDTLRSDNATSTATLAGPQIDAFALLAKTIKPETAIVQIIKRDINELLGVSRLILKPKSSEK